MEQNIEIIICTESGALEQMSKLLIYSIRNYTGIFKNCPIYSYQPRAIKPISLETIKFFEEYDVQYINENLNYDYVDYPLANKPFSCAHRENNSSAEYLLFLDTDTFFLDVPLIFKDLENYDVAIQSADYDNIGTDLYFTKGENRYWKRLYEILNVRRKLTVESTINRAEMLEYYNSGFILTKRKIGLFNQWLKNFKLVMQEGLLPEKGLYFVEQSVFSATVAQMNLKVKPLGKSYNYPVETYSKKWRGFYPYTLKDKIHVHYHKMYNDNPYVNPLKRKLRALSKGADINEKIEKFLLIP